MGTDIPPCAKCGAPVRLVPTTENRTGSLLPVAGEPRRKCTNATCSTNARQRFLGDDAGKA